MRPVLVIQGDKVSFNVFSKNYSIPAHVEPALAAVGVELIES